MNPAKTSDSTGSRARRVLVLPLLLPIELYRKLISPLIAPRCRYYPSCSSYAVEALKTYGPIRGSVLAAWRVMRCNPWSDGGIDEVQNQTLFNRHRHTENCAKNHKVSDEATV